MLRPNVPSPVGEQRKPLACLQGALKRLRKRGGVGVDGPLLQDPGEVRVQQGEQEVLLVAELVLLPKLQANLEPPVPDPRVLRHIDRQDLDGLAWARGLCALQCGYHPLAQNSKVLGAKLWVSSNVREAQWRSSRVQAKAPS